MGSYYDSQAADPDAIVGAVEAVPRRNFTTSAAPLGGSGRVNFTYFTAKSQTTITKVNAICGGTAAGATPTLCRVGFYTVASNGDLTLVCACANDTALFASQFTDYVRDLSTGGSLPASYTFNAGSRYAAAIVVVSGATLPTFYGNSSQSTASNFRAPVLSSYVTGQTDLPTSVSSGSLSSGFTHFGITGLA